VLLIASIIRLTTTGPSLSACLVPQKLPRQQQEQQQVITYLIVICFILRQQNEHSFLALNTSYSWRSQEGEA
jgi:hypothetical protein